MRDLEHARMLLSLAQEDLAVLKVIGASPNVHDRIFGFHAQQVAEKCLKAWLSLLGVIYPLTYSLDVLLGLLEDQIGAEASEFRDVAMLTPFAVQFRYAAYEGPESEINRADLAAKVERLLEHVNGLA
jgi:HEPN domain-containing protein